MAFDSTTHSTKIKAERSSTKTRHRWIRWLRIGIAIIVAVAIGVTIRKSANQFAQQEIRLTDINFGLLAGSSACYLLAMLFSCVFWSIAIKSLRGKAIWSQVLTAFFAGQLGKYVPGKAMVVIIRAAIVSGKGVTAKVAAASVFVETLTWVFVGSMIACALISVQFPDHHALRWAAIVMAASAGALTFPPLFKRIATRLTGTDSDVFAGLGFGTMLLGWILMSIGWCCNAASLQLAIASLPDVNVDAADFNLMLACVSLATVAGFVSLLPGGLGVRELVMIPLLAPRFGEPIAVVAAVLIRLVWIATELASSAIIYAVSSQRRKQQAEGHS